MSFDRLHELLKPLDPVFAVLQFAWPILMLCLALCLYFAAKSNNASQHVETSKRHYACSAVEDPTCLRNDSAKPKPWFRTNIALGIAFCVSLTAGATGTIGGVIGIFPGNQPESTHKSPDIIKFEKFMSTVDAHMASGDKGRAKALLMDALSLKQIPLISAAEPMNGVAKILIDENRLDAAEPLAYLAARLHSQDPVYVNTYATILIETCRLPKALDILKGLELDQDFESRRLLELADAKIKACDTALSSQ